MPKKQTSSKKPADTSKELAPLEELTPEEKAKIEEWIQSEKVRQRPPRFNVTQGETLEIGHAGPDNKAALWAEAIQNATGFKYVVQGANYISKVAQSINPFFEQEPSVIQKCLNDTAANLFELKPEDATEALLVGQMLATNNAALDCMRRAMLKEQTAYGREFNMKYADRFMRTFTAQLEALTKYRKGGQQKVTVEHVHVYRGGQAIVGNINQAGGGRGEHQHGGTTSCQQSIGQRSPGVPLRLENGQEVWCEMQEDGPPLPTTSDA